MYDNAIYIYKCLYVLTLLLFVFSGKKLAKAKNIKQYWKWAIIPIVMYVVFAGLRFGRGGDYNIYYFEFENLKDNINNNDRFEYLFVFYVRLFHLIGLSYKFFIAFNSFLLITLFLYVCSSCKKILPYALLLFFWEIRPAENLIRWYIAVIPFIIMVSNLNRKKYLFAFILGGAAVFIHSGFYPMILFTFFVFCFQNYLIPYRIALIIFFICILIGSSKIFLFFAPYLSFLNINERSGRYIEAFQDIVNGDFGIMGIRQMSWSTQIRVFIAYSFPIICIPTLVKKGYISKFIANLFILGVIFSPIMNQVEILSRYSQTLLLFSIVVSGYSYYNSFTSLERMDYYAVLSFICYVFPILSLLLSEIPWNLTLYVWDSNGWGYLPINYLKE